MSLPRYPEYKDSGISWLWEVPAHWGERRTKYLFDLMKRPVRDEDEIVTAFRDGQVTLRSNRRTDGFTNALQEIGYQGVRRGDLVIHSMDAFAGAVGVSDSDGKSTPVYSVCRPRVGTTNSHYYAHVLRYMAIGGFIASLAKGIRERSTDFRWADAGSLLLPMPPLEEQEAIVAFLGRETAKIDALITEQEKLLALLAEKRQATISHAVTRGLTNLPGADLNAAFGGGPQGEGKDSPSSPNVPMKDSGIPWLGEVPAHWDVVMLRRVVLGFEQGWSPECEGRLAEGDEWGVLKAGCVNGGRFRPEEHKALPSALDPRPELEIRHGDVLMSRASGSPQLIGSVAFVDSPPPRLMLSDKVFRLKLASDIRRRFFALAMRSVSLRSQIEQAIGGAEGLANNLPQARIKDFWLALPSIHEQIEIERHVEQAMCRFDALEQQAKQSIDLLKERRSALISAAVTGKVDVRSAA